jgi:hypothetical protein
VVSFIDRIIEEVDQGLKVLSGAVLASRSLETPWVRCESYR